MTSSSQPERLPLSDIRVVDFSGNLAGPYCGQILADLGARVVKVERPGRGDPARDWAPPAWGGDGTLFLAANRGKRSLALELGAPGAEEVVDRLLKGADVAIQAFRPDVARRFGLTEEVLRERHPHLLLCSITAFDPEGTRAHRPGYDPLLQAHTGIMSVTGPAGGGPVRVGTSIMDLGAGMWAAIGVLSALRRRDRGGSGPGGGHVRVSLEDVGIAWSAYHLMGVEATGRVPGPMGTGLGMIAPYGAFPTLDGALLIAAGNDVLFQRLCAAMDLDELGSDPRLRTNPDRVAHRELLEKALADATRGYTTAELEARLEGRGVPCAAIRDMGEVARDPEVRRGAFRAEEHPRIPGYRAVAPPPVFDGKRLPPPPPPPAPGEHSEAILEELGFTPSRIRALKEEGAVGPGPGDPTMSER